MKHSNDLYLTHSKVGRTYGDGTKAYYWSDSWSTAASIAGTLVTLLVVSSVALGIFSDPEALNLPNWPWQLTTLSTVVVLAFHFIMATTYDGRQLTAAGNWALRKFLALPADVQAEMGGRDAFVSRLITLTDSDTHKLISAIEKAHTARERREQLEAQLASHSGDLMETLDRYTGEQQEYVKTLKELM